MGLTINRIFKTCEYPPLGLMKRQRAKAALWVLTLAPVLFIAAAILSGYLYGSYAYIWHAHFNKAAILYPADPAFNPATFRIEHYPPASRGRVLYGLCRPGAALPALDTALVVSAGASRIAPPSTSFDSLDGSLVIYEYQPWYAAYAGSLSRYPAAWTLTVRVDSAGTIIKCMVSAEAATGSI